ncbi:MAG: CoA transferase, partial [Alphaproteobacteria bacterium]
RATGRGQVVDAAMTDGVASMSALYHAFRTNGLWSDTRADNLLDGAAPFYRCYACADGRHIAVGALEPQFFRQFLAGIGLAPDAYPQHDRSVWPAMERHFAAILASRSRDAWAEVFAETDACVTPVLDWDEASRHPHNIMRDTFVARNGSTQPAPAPRFSETPAAITEPESATVTEMLGRWAN